MDVLYGGAVNVLGAACTLSSLGAIAAIKDKEHMSASSAAAVWHTTSSPQHPAWR